MAAILKYGHKMPFYQRKKIYPMFFLFIHTLNFLLYQQKNQFAPQKNPTPLHICPYYHPYNLETSKRFISECTLCLTYRKQVVVLVRCFDLSINFTQQYPEFDLRTFELFIGSQNNDTSLN